MLPPFRLGHRFDLFRGDSIPVALPRLFGVRFEGGRAKFVLMATAFALCALGDRWRRDRRGGLAAGIFLGSPLLGNLFHSVSELPLLLAGTAGIGMGRDPNGFVVRMREEWAPVWAQPSLALGVGALLVGVWLLRMVHALANWPYAVISLAVLLLAPAAVARLSGRAGRRARAGAVTAAGPSVPLEWVGITRPYTADDIALLQQMVPLPEVGGA